MSLRDKFLKKTRKAVKARFNTRDMLLGHCAKVIEGLDTVINVLYEKLEDAFAIYFPEFKVRNKQVFLNVVARLSDKRKGLDVFKQFFNEDKARFWHERAQHSMGAELKAEDVERLRSLAQRVLELMDERERWVEFAEHLAREVAPNTTHLLGGLLTAKLISHVKSVEKLATLPASTIQVLGAEKALFKHLRSKGRVKPPKHGYLFQHPKVSSAPKKLRGKIARTLAAKVALAAKVDAYGGEFIGDKLRQAFEQRCEEVLSKKGKRG